MVVKQVDGLRRKLIGVVLKGASAGLLWGTSTVRASEKMTPQQAQYQGTPNGMFSCEVCTLFEAPNACKVVEGEVSKDGWCKAFAMVD